MDIPIGHVHKAEPERRSKKGAQWTNPGGFTSKEWKTLLQEVWEEEKTTDKWWTRSMPDVDDNWKQIMLLLDQFYRTAYGEAKKKLETKINGVEATDGEKEVLAMAI